MFFIGIIFAFNFLVDIPKREKGPKIELQPLKGRKSYLLYVTKQKTKIWNLKLNLKMKSLAVQKTHQKMLYIWNENKFRCLQSFSFLLPFAYFMLLLGCLHLAIAIFYRYLARYVISHAFQNWAMGTTDSGGLGFSANQIGTLTSFMSISVIFIQFFIYNPLITKTKYTFFEQCRVTFQACVGV